MTNNCASRVFGMLGVLAVMTFAFTQAAEAQTALGGKLVVCGVCHGVDGSPKLEGVPIIWGLQENYILKQLREFKHGERTSDVMK
jgi:cytochrome c553